MSWKNLFPKLYLFLRELHNWIRGHVVLWDIIYLEYCNIMVHNLPTTAEMTAGSQTMLSFSLVLLVALEMTVVSEISHFYQSSSKCVHVCVCACAYESVCVCVWGWCLSVYVFICTCVCVCDCKRVHVCKCVHVSVYIYRCTCACVPLHVCVWAGVRTHTYVCTHFSLIFRVI